MLMDVQNQFSDKQAVTAAAASENVIDLGDAGQTWHGQTVEADVGKGGERDILLHIAETFAGGGFTALQIYVEVSDDEAFSAPEANLIADLPVAKLILGASFRRIVPHGTNKRYMRLQYTPIGGSASAGQITASIVDAFQDNDIAVSA